MEAVDLARAAAVEIARAEWVGEHLSAYVEGDRVVTHLFACLDPAYKGWHYAVTVARASRAKKVTVNEAVLLPGGEALLAPNGCRGRSACAPATSAWATSCPAPRTTTA